MEGHHHGGDGDEHHRLRRSLLRTGGIGVAMWATGGFGAPGYSGRESASAASAASDVQTLQTAASLENLAVATYTTVLELPFMANVPPFVRTFAVRTKEQHAEHARAFNAAVTRLGGKTQDRPDPVMARTVEQAKPTLRSPLDVVGLAIELETAASQTCQANSITLRDMAAKRVAASITGVEAQHIAVLHLVRALLQGDDPELLAAPTATSRLPADAGKIGFPAGFQRTDKARPADEGAIA